MTVQHRHRVRNVAILVAAALVLAASPAAGNRDVPERGYDSVASMRYAYPQDDVRRAQRALEERGYYRGEVDGRLSDETAAALQRFQRDHERLASHGRLDVSTRTALGIDAPRPEASAATRR